MHTLGAPPAPHSLTSETDKQFFTEWEESFDSFDQMGLHENLLRGIYAYGGFDRRDCLGLMR